MWRFHNSERLCGKGLRSKVDAVAAVQHVWIGKFVAPSRHHEMSRRRLDIARETTKVDDRFTASAAPNMPRQTRSKGML